MNSCMQRIVVSDPMGMTPRLSLIDEVLLGDPIFHLETSLDHTDSNNNNSNSSSSGSSAGSVVEDVGLDKVEEVTASQRKSEKYSLRPRSIQKRLETELKGKQVSESKSSRRGGGSKSGGGRPKQKPPPLSKYRRKTANARERDRMREINAAFEALRRAVPHLSEACQGSEKLTKITTLRLAMKYIAALSQALKTPEPELGPLSDLDCLLLGSDTDSLALTSDLSDLDDTDLCQHYLGDSDLSEHCLTP